MATKKLASRKVNTARKHTVRVTTPRVAGLVLGSGDLRFYATRGKSAIGRLYVSQGGVKWASRYGKKKVMKTVSWSKFDQIMREGSGRS